MWLNIPSAWPYSVTASNTGTLRAERNLGKMKNALKLTGTFVLLVWAFSCSAQNGPTKPPVHSVTLNFTQSAGSGLKFNCFYRGTAAGVYTLPGTCSQTPVTSFVDTNVVSGASYHYAVTASTGTAESAYSNDVAVTIPTDPQIPPAPSGLATIIAELKKPFTRGKTLAFKSADGKLTAIAR